MVRTARHAVQAMSNGGALRMTIVVKSAKPYSEKVMHDDIQHQECTSRTISEPGGWVGPSIRYTIAPDCTGMIP